MDFRALLHVMFWSINQCHCSNHLPPFLFNRHFRYVYTLCYVYILDSGILVLEVRTSVRCTYLQQMRASQIMWIFPAGETSLILHIRLWTIRESYTWCPNRIHELNAHCWSHCVRIKYTTTTNDQLLSPHYCSPRVCHYVSVRQIRLMTSRCTRTPAESLTCYNKFINVTFLKVKIIITIIYQVYYTPRIWACKSFNQGYVSKL